MQEGLTLCLLNLDRLRYAKSWHALQGTDVSGQGAEPFKAQPTLSASVLSWRMRPGTGTSASGSTTAGAAVSSVVVAATGAAVSPSTRAAGVSSVCAKSILAGGRTTRAVGEHPPW